MCLDTINKVILMNCFKLPQHTNKRKIHNSTITTNPANDTETDTSNLSHNVKRKLVFEENEENAFIKLNDVCNSTQTGYNGRYSKT